MIKLGETKTEVRNVIIGIVVAFVVVVIIAIFVACFLCNRKSVNTNTGALVTEPQYELPSLPLNSEIGYLVPLRRPVPDTPENSNVEHHADRGNNNEESNVPGESGSVIPPNDESSYVIPPNDESSYVIPPNDEFSYVIPPSDESQYEIMP